MEQQDCALYSDKYKESVRPLLDVIDQVREDLENVREINLPQIVVIGDQSAGKSSILESISQIYLPRGEGCVTRAPLELQLRSLSHDEEEYAEIKTQGKEDNISNLQNIGNVIQEYQQFLEAQEGRMITETKIHLKVHKHDLPDLTLVDLPGLAYNKKEICETVRSLVSDYCSNQNAIVLQVLSATQDFNTCEGTMLADEHDALRTRRISIVSKIDTAEKGINQKIRQYMQAGSIGVVAVKNRTQEDLNNNISIQQARANEASIFKTHPELMQLPAVCKGYDQLIQLITKVQADKVIGSISSIKMDIFKELQKKQRELDSMPKACVSDQDKHLVLQNMCSAMERDLRNICEGNYARNTNQETHIRVIMYKIAKQFMENLFSEGRCICKQHYLEHLEQAADIDIGVSLPNFQSQKPILPKFLDLLSQTEELGHSMISESCEKMLHVLQSVIDVHFSAYQELQQLVSDATQQQLQERQQAIENYLNRLVKSEQYTIDSVAFNSQYLSAIQNIQDFDFADQIANEEIWTEGGVDHLSDNNRQLFEKLQLPEQLKTSYFKPKIDQKNVNQRKALVLRQSLLAYWVIVCIPKMVDSLYKEICTEIVEFVSTQYRNYIEQQFSPLFETDYQEELRKILGEPAQMTMKRNNLQESIARLELANKRLANAMSQSKLKYK